jgi:hypothetical protein
MITKEYIELIRKYQAPSKEDIERFIGKFANEHSWYKHLSDKRDCTFFFFLLPPTTSEDNHAIFYYVWSDSFHKSWDENYTNEEERDEVILKKLTSEYSIPKEILEQGKIKLSRFIHERAFSNATEYFIESPERKSFTLLYKEITNELIDHLNQISNHLFVNNF